MKCELKSLLSQNDLCQSWLAADGDTGEECFVKTVNPESPLDSDTADKILKDSYRLQQRLTNERIHTAKKKYLSRGQLFIQYKHLDPTIWNELTEDSRIMRFQRSGG